MADDSENPVINPVDVGATPMSGNNFVENPRGSNTGVGKVRDFYAQPPAAPQKPLDEKGFLAESTDDAAPGAKTAAEAVSVPPSRAGDVGVGTIGNGAKPYKLGS